MSVKCASAYAKSAGYKVLLWLVGAKNVVGGEVSTHVRELMRKQTVLGMLMLANPSPMTKTA